MAEKLGALESERAPASDDFVRNTATLARVLGLTSAERELVTFAIVMQLIEGLAILFRDVGPARFAETCRLSAIALGTEEGQVRHALRAEGVLRSTGLITFYGDPSMPYVLEPMSGLVEAMLHGRRTPRAVMRMFARRSPTTQLDVTSFAHAAEDVDAIVRVLKGALRRRARGVNLLIHGAAGTGKTELVRVVADAARATLFEVGDSDDEGDPTPGRDRLSECAIAQRILASSPRAMLVFDEVEDVFQARWEGSLGLVRESGGAKSWTHRLLEGASVPTVWLSNEIRHMDPATLRRFDLVVELKTPPTAVRLRMLREALGTTTVDEALLNRLAADQRLTPAHVARAVRVTRLMNARDPKDATEVLSHVLTRNLAAHGPARARPAVPLVCGPYDLGLVNAATDLRLVTEAIVRQRRASVCLYGPPGTGKTTWAAHLAERMQVPIRAARASDLLNCYVGETEKNIAKMFAETREEGALLFLDEADSFLQDRANALHSWQVTQVNELLVQMEAFDGVFLCATNLIDSLDRASLRRFSMKIEFRALRPEGRWTMLLRLVPAAEGDRGLRAVLDRLDGLTAGDFAAVARQAKLAGAEGDARSILDMLEREVMLRRRGASRPIGFEGGLQ